MASSAHRLGRRTSLLTASAGRRASFAEFLETVADVAAAEQVAAAATLIVRTAEGQAEVPVAAAHRVAVDRLLPTRRPPSYRTMRNYIGKYPVPAPGGTASVWFESLNELSHIRDLLLTQPVAALASQPLLIAWDLPGGRRYHYPDLLVARPGRPLLCDVTRAATSTRPLAVAQFQMTALTAEAAGWEFQLRTELPLQRQRTQASILVSRPRPGRDLRPFLERILDHHWPVQFAAAASRLGAGPPGRAALLELIAARQLFIDFDQPLTLESVVNDDPFAGPQPWLRSW